ncbi:MAG: ABC transporter ATP-binding protein [Rhizobiaceae bacterium]|nr:ABC transporter ATP-binding protein [Rhizobiaceae bacterium]
MDKAMLSISRLEGGYGESAVLHGIDLEIRPGEVVTLLGRNGAGKSTTLKAIIGILEKREGSIRFDGKETIRMSSDAIARLGVAYCPEERAIFGSLTVDENMALPPVIAKGGLGVSEIQALFPNLQHRRHAYGSHLSGGEQQMLAIGRILRTGARFLLLDEPTEGLAPVIVKQIGQTIDALKRKGFTILLVEQNFRFALRHASRHYVMEEGRVAEMLEGEISDEGMKRIESYLGV